MATTVFEKENTLDYREIRLEGAKAEVYSDGLAVKTVKLISGTWLNNGNGGTFTQDTTFDPVVYDVESDYNLNLLAQVLEEVKRAEISQETGKSFSLYYTSGDYGYITGATLQAVRYGESGTPISAMPLTNCYFVEWSDGITTNPRTDVAVTKDIQVSANFAINTYTLAYLANNNGTISGKQVQIVEAGQNGLIVVAIPNADYVFSGWSDGILTASRQDLNVVNNVSAIANFELRELTLTYTADANGTIVGTTPQTIEIHSNGTLVTATPNADYVFKSWSDGVLTASRQDMNVVDNINAIASFELAKFNCTYAAGTNGTITGTSPQIVEIHGDATSVTAIPYSGYVFSAWSDGVLTAERTDMNVTADIDVTATFIVEPNTFTCVYTAGTNGTITGTASQIVVENGNATQVTAVANSGYVFEKWSDDVMTAARTDINVTADIAVTATFVSE